MNVKNNSEQSMHKLSKQQKKQNKYSYPKKTEKLHQTLGYPNSSHLLQESIGKVTFPFY